MSESDITHRVVVQVNYLLAASALCTPDNHEVTSGVLLEPHPAHGEGVLISSTNGREMGLIFDEAGVIEGEPVSWVIPHETLLGMIRKAQAKVDDFQDMWAVLTSTENGVAHLELVEAINSGSALHGVVRRSLAKKAVQSSGHVYDELRPKVTALIQGATAEDRSTAPASWFRVDGFTAIATFADGLTILDPASLALSVLRTKRKNVVQIAFSHFEEAACFIITMQQDRHMRTDNPGWLDALL